MCGFIGVYKKNFDVDISKNDITKALKVINHRGPDYSNVTLEKNVILGHNRLKIIDTSSSANQPFYSQDKRYALIFNGEIYNFLILKEKYFKDETFISNSDTELLLKGLINFKEGFIKHLNGMFAFLFIDFQKNKIILARDRFGKKPLYIYEDSEKIIWSSEIKAILKVPKVKKEIDLNAISEYLKRQYVPFPLTGFKNIKKFEQSSYQIIRNGVAEKNEKYWSLDYCFKRKGNINELIEEFSIIMESSVNLRLISDVPLGVFLSGGIDLSLIHI